MGRHLRLVGSGEADRWRWDDDEAERWAWDDTTDWRYWEREELQDTVGGAKALANLDAEPLPDEPFDWAGITAAGTDRVREVLALCDGCCDSMFDVEHRTATRRLLARVARRAPDAFRRGRVDTTAAALCWAVGIANRTIGRRATHTAKEVLAYFGLKGTIVGRATTLLRAAGIRDQPEFCGLGSADYLVAARRRALIDRRDALDRDDDPEPDYWTR